MPIRAHTDSQFENELHQLRNALLYMGGEIEKNISEAMVSLSSSDETMARQIIQRDHLVNCLEIEIDDLCLRILALRQPAASDLRFITTALKIVTDLERIGDLSVHIAQRALQLGPGPHPPAYRHISQMARSIQEMVHSALDAFVKREAELAERVLVLDRDVDQLNTQVFNELTQLMTEEPQNIPRTIALLNVSKYLERIGDHATNVAEMVVFMVRGKDIRHMWSRQNTERNRRS